MLITEEQKIFELLKIYVNGDMSRSEFTESYSKLLPGLSDKLDEGLYDPLDVIIPTEDNSEQAWKENMREMYLREIENLDNLLEEDEQSYSEQLSEQQQKELCQRAIKYIPIAALDRSSKKWIENNLIENEEFVFFDGQGKSKFESHKVLYEAKLVQKSFIMTAFCGGLPQLDFKYSELIDVLKDNDISVSTVWARCSEPDGFALVASAPWYTNTSDEIENLNWLEYTDPQTTQWGVCHLVFMPSNKEWMLVHTNDFNNFSIALHGKEVFISNILERLARSV